MSARDASILEPFVPRLALDWLATEPQAQWHQVSGTLVFVDISGFTALTERLSRRGKVGAEQLTDVLNGTFERLLEEADAEGADLIKWGGDAMLLLFEGPGHASRASRAAHHMRTRLEQRGRQDRRVGQDRRHGTRRERADRAGLPGRRHPDADRRTTSRDRTGADLHMSVGIHSGTFTFCLVGDPADHRELLLVGPDVSRTVEMESTAVADQIGISSDTAALLDPSCVGEPLGPGFLLAALPEHVDWPSPSEEHQADPTILLSRDIRAFLLEAPEEPEHRRIAIGFVKFTGTDALLADHGPAAVTEALDRLVRTVQQAADRNGVTVLASDLDLDGGKILLTSGAPINRGHSEERLLRAMRDIADSSDSLKVKIGVNHGAVFAGDVGPYYRRTYTVMGDAVNLAARVMGKAAPGEIVATESTLASVPAMFAATPLEPFLVKGKTDPVHASKVGARLADAAWRRQRWVPEALLDSDRAGEAAAFVGRHPEKAVIDRAYEAAILGNGSLILVTGAPGIGVSRFLAQVAAHRTAHGTRGDEYQSATPYAPFRELLASVLGIEAATPEEASRVLAGVVGERAPALLPWLPLIALVLNVPAEPTPEVDALADEFRRARLEAVTVDLLRVMLTDPCLIVVDDAHLLDEASRSLLQAIGRAAGDEHWVVLIAGPDTAAWPDDGMSRLEIGPLDPDDARALVVAALGDHPLAPADIKGIVERGAGSPSFLRSLVHSARSGIALSELPESAGELVAAQVDALAAHERTALRYAAVLGMTFDAGQLQHLVESRLDAAAALEALTYFVTREGDQYRFEQALVREAAYEGLPYRVRRTLHGRAADRLVATTPDPSSISELLSLHYANANRPEPAWRYSVISGGRATGKFAHAEAEVFYVRALQTARRLRGLDPIERAEVYVRLARSQDAIGRLEQSVQALREGRRRLRGRPLLVADALATEASVLKRMGKYPQVMRAVNQALTTLTDVPGVEADHLRSDLKMVAAGLRGQQGRIREALDWAQRAAVDAEASGLAAPQAHAAAMIHVFLLYLGMPDRAQGERALEWYRQAGDRRREAEALNNLAMQDWQEGRGEQALEMFRMSAEVAEAAGDAFTSGLTLGNVGDVLVRLGRAEEAEPILREVVATQHALRASAYEATARRSLAVAIAHRGRFDEARRMLAEVHQEQVRIGEEDELTETCIAQALVEVLAGDSAAALEHAHLAEDRAREAEAVYLLVPTLRVKAAALIEADRHGEARAVLDEAWDGCDEAEFERGFILAEFAHVEARDGDLDAAALRAAQARDAWEVFGWVGSLRYPIG